MAFPRQARFTGRLPTSFTSCHLPSILDPTNTICGTPHSTWRFPKATGADRMTWHSKQGSQSHDPRLDKRDNYPWPRRYRNTRIHPSIGDRPNPKPPTGRPQMCLNGPQRVFGFRIPRRSSSQDLVSQGISRKISGLLLRGSVETAKPRAHYINPKRSRVSVLSFSFP